MRAASKLGGGSCPQQMEEGRALSPPSVNGMNELFHWQRRTRNSTICWGERKVRGTGTRVLSPPHSGKNNCPGPYHSRWLEQTRPKHEKLNRSYSLSVLNNWGKPKCRTTPEFLPFFYLWLPLFSSPTSLPSPPTPGFQVQTQVPGASED